MPGRMQGSGTANPAGLGGRPAVSTWDVDGEAARPVNER